ncbi:hypothetical protein [Nocardioides sp. NPDC006303]|uniref:hypothetical protein n=1 Tax=Nocardioides sp. NPDC006303 TaxID=3156747 RepID=UPI0033AE78D9
MSSRATESGTVILKPKDVKALGKDLRDWTNRTHQAVMFEVTTMCDGLPSTAGGLEALVEKLKEHRAKWADAAAPELKLLINRLALRGIEAHVGTCRETGRLRVATARALDELLPKRSSNDMYFRVPDAHGNIAAGLTLDYDAVLWLAEPTVEAPASAARETPLAKLALARLRSFNVPPGGGGQIVNDTTGKALVSFG